MTHLEDELRHETVVNDIFDRLRQVGRYDTLEKHVQYHVGKYWGELDIYSSTEKYMNYYEIKGSDHPNGLARAMCQFKRFKDSHPLLAVRYIYITPNKVRRIYL